MRAGAARSSAPATSSASSGTERFTSASATGPSSWCCTTVPTRPTGRVPLTSWGGNSYEQCAALEEGIETPGGFFQISYPYTFHAEAGDPFPNLRAHNREQCARALWTFHTIESYLPAPPAG